MTIEQIMSVVHKFGELEHQIGRMGGGSEFIAKSGALRDSLRTQIETLIRERDEAMAQRALTWDEAEVIIRELDDRARAHDVYDYGLPIHFDEWVNSTRQFLMQLRVPDQRSQEQKGGSHASS